MEEEEEGGLEEELEAARAIYGAEAVAAAAAPGPSGAARVKVRVRPRAGRVEFVRATLALEFPGGGEYPLERGPALALEAVQGLGDERTAEALRVLAAAAEDYRGLPQLLVLVAALEEFLDAENRPHGACPLCMEPFAAPARPCVRLSGCYHAYCRDCFFAWAKWRAAEIEKNNRATAEERKVALSSLPTALHCPVCRLEIAEAETRPPEGWRKWRPPAEAEAPAQLPALPADVRREAMKLQRKFKKVLERQRAKGGLIVGDGEEEGAGSGGIRVLRTQLDNTTLVAEATEEEPAAEPRRETARGRGRGRGPRGRGRGRGRGGRGGRGRGRGGGGNGRGGGGNGRGRGGNGRNSSSQRARAYAAGH